jgi:hypothetical protein
MNFTFAFVSGLDLRRKFFPIKRPCLAHERRFAVREPARLLSELTGFDNAAAVHEPAEAPRGISAAAETEDKNFRPGGEKLTVLVLRAHRAGVVIDEPAVPFENLLIETPAERAAAYARSVGGADTFIVEFKLVRTTGIAIGDRGVHARDVGAIV